MTCVINNQVVLSRVPEGPLEAHINAFAEFISAQGYTLGSIHKQVLLAACFSRWLKQERVELHHITSDHPRQYLQYRARKVQPCLGDAAALKRLIDFLRDEDLIPLEKVSVPESTPVDRCTQAYAQHLREAQALVEALCGLVSHGV